MKDARDHFFGSHYEGLHAEGPFRSLNPTVRYHPVEKDSGNVASDSRRVAPKPGVQSPCAYYLWRSRDNRKGRHAIVLDPTYGSKEGHEGPTPTDTVGQVLEGLIKMLVTYPVWDVSYDVAYVFTIGSLIWVVNGFFSFLPEVAPSTDFKGEATWAAGLTALVGATVFEFGSILLMLEAMNENRSDCFGWAVEETLDGFLRVHRDNQCVHSHLNKCTFVKGESHKQLKEASAGQRRPRTWSWWPTWYELETHYVKDIGFLACCSQMVGATVFWIAGFTALPPIFRKVSLPAQNGIYWLPQVVGGCGFIISSLLFMLEVQPRWYTPAPKTLGWHIGLWNLIGAVGFTVCGALGFDAADEAVTYALTLSTFIGSWAFLIGSLLQLYESLDKYPIWVDKKVQQLSVSQGET